MCQLDGVLHHSRHLWVVRDEYLITTEAGSHWVYELETLKMMKNKNKTSSASAELSCEVVLERL